MNPIMSDCNYKTVVYRDSRNGRYSVWKDMRIFSKAHPSFLMAYGTMLIGTMWDCSRSSVMDG